MLNILNSDNRGGEEQHRGTGHPLRQDFQNRAGKVTEGDAEISGKGVLQVDEVLLPERLVQTERRPDLLSDIGRQVGIENVEGGVVAGLGLNQKEGKGNYQEEGEDYLSHAADQVAGHWG